MMPTSDAKPAALDIPGCAMRPTPGAGGRTIIAHSETLGMRDD